MQTPILKTPRLRLRPFCASDAQAVFTGWENDPKVAEYMFWRAHNDIEKTKAWLAEEIEKLPSDDWYRWAVELQDSGELIGTGLVYLEETYGLFEIGYNFGRAFWGQGYATETMREIVRFARKILHVDTLIARYAVENPASGHVLQKLGFVPTRTISYEANEGIALYEGIECRLSLK